MRMSKTKERCGCYIIYWSQKVGRLFIQLLMQANLSPSVNIIRDSERPPQYFSTPNSLFIFGQIAGAFKTGVRSFSIVGSYGTGKSPFLLALMQHFSLKQFEFLSIVGENRAF